jgi:hypothetical protein
VERTGENWTKGKGRKGKEAGGSGGEAEENVTELERTGRKEGERRRKHNRGRGTIPRRYTRTRVERTGETWTQGKGRKGKEAGGSGVGNEVERTGENWTQGKGRKGKEAEGNTREQGRRDPWRNLYRTVERTGENWTQGKGRKGKEAENAKGGATPLKREDERSGENWTQGRGRKRSATKGP